MVLFSIDFLQSPKFINVVYHIDFVGDNWIESFEIFDSVKFRVVLFRMSSSLFSVHYDSTYFCNTELDVYSLPLVV